MIIIYGQRTYGAVDEQAGQYAVTRFAHVYYMPLFPVGSFWMTGPSRGIETPLNGKSVVAGYARTWGLIAGIGMGTAGFGTSIVVGLMGLALAGASAMTWKLWGKRSTEEAKLRGNLNALAFGTYCAPERLAGPIRAHYELELARRQQVTPNARPPEDVARFGTRDLGELVRAYGILSLHPSGAARAQLAELLELKAPSNELTDGIYREKHADDAEPFQLPADRAARVAAIEAAASQRMLNA